MFPGEPRRTIGFPKILLSVFDLFASGESYEQFGWFILRSKNDHLGGSILYE